MARIYLNHAATTYPKPASVKAAVTRWFDQPPVDPGRDAGCEKDPLEECREQVSRLLGVSEPKRVALLPSATHAINLVTAAELTDGSHVITTELEHNSVLRPVAHLERDRNIRATYLAPGPDGRVPAADVRSAICESTRLVILTHASNVSGSVQPIMEVAKVVAAAGVPFLVDASQSAGLIPMRHDRLPGRVFVAAAGHKGLMGPPGVGVLILPDAEVAQTIVGGTGVRSESPLHPADLPLRHEAGTPNMPGIVGLTAGVKAVLEQGVEELGLYRQRLVHSLRRSLSRLADIALLPLAHDDGRAGIVSFNLRGWSPESLGFLLRESFGMETRAGLHCAPRAHKVYGTDPLGTVRVSFGPGNDENHVDALTQALSRTAGA